MTSYQIDRTTWAQRSIFEQMGNIYAEVGRTIKAKESGDESLFSEALTRAIDLFDATAEVHIAKKSPKAREVLLAKYQFLSLFYAKRRTENQASLEKYFFDFALAARLQK